MTERNRFERRNSDRARAITKAKAKRQNILVASVAVVLVAAVAASFLIFGAVNAQPKAAGAAPTTAIATSAEANLANGNAALPTAATTDYTQAYTQSDAQQTYEQASVQEAPAQQSEDRIDNINGERVYIDTKRIAPEVTGAPAHYYAYGKTSYGFDWNYSADNGNFVVACNYNFDQQQYDFTFYGTAQGVSNVTLYYNTDDNVQVPVQLTVNVDSDLNVTVY